MGILNNFESWARSDNNNDSSNKRRGFEPWARPNHSDIASPSTNPAQDIDDAALYKMVLELFYTQTEDR